MIICESKTFIYLAYYFGRARQTRKIGSQIASMAPTHSIRPSIDSRSLGLARSLASSSWVKRDGRDTCSFKRAMFNFPVKVWVHGSCVGLQGLGCVWAVMTMQLTWHPAPGCNRCSYDLVAFRSGEPRTNGPAPSSFWYLNCVYPLAKGMSLKLVSQTRIDGRRHLILAHLETRLSRVPQGFGKFATYRR